MYEEFIIGYAISSLAVILLAAVIVLQCVILKRISGDSIRTKDSAHTTYSGGISYASGNRGVAICRHCATQFDAAHTICPKCGTPR